MWCRKRITNKNLLGRFGDEKHRFYFESVCGMPLQSNTSNLCVACLSLTVQTKTQDVRTFPHGLVSDAYTKESHIYDSTWYLSKVSAYGQPTLSTIELAMKAQKRAKAGVKTNSIECLEKDTTLVVEPVVKPVVEPVVEPVVQPVVQPVKTAEPVKKKRASKAVVTEVKPEIVSEEPKVEVKVPKKRASSKKKELPKLEPDPSSSVLTHLGAVKETIHTTIPNGSIVETMDTPLEVNTVVRVVLKSFTHNSIHYWRDSSLEKIYKKMADGSIGEYIGRYDSISDCIVKDAPDSDDD